MTIHFDKRSNLTKSTFEDNPVHNQKEVLGGQNIMCPAIKNRGTFPSLPVNPMVVPVFEIYVTKWGWNCRVIVVGFNLFSSKEEHPKIPPWTGKSLVRYPGQEAEGELLPYCERCSVVWIARPDWLFKPALAN